jgi:hypothetical protein
MDAAFSPDAIAKLDDGDRPERLRAMQAALAERLSRDATIGEFFGQSRQLIDELRTLGHDLWSFDSDGEDFESWCGDWTRADGGGPLTITFHYPSEVEVSWRGLPLNGRSLDGR